MEADVTPVPPEHAPNPMAAPPPGGGGGRSSAIIVGLAVAGVAALCCVAGLAAIALPSFTRFGARSKQSEVKVNLKAAYASERAYFGAHDRYVTDVDQLGFSPAPGRYLYAFAIEGARRPATTRATGPFTGVEAVLLGAFTNEQLEDAVPEWLWREVGVSGECPKCDVTVLGVGDLDGDRAVDVWTISTKDRTIDGVVVPAGQPWNHVDDTKD